MPPWMEQHGNFLCDRINSGHIGAFAKIAVDAGQGKIVQGVGTSMLPGNNVLDMQKSQG